ncbi:hypothetical protein ACHAXS_011742 [Conticribra weissflogii]
MGPEDSLENLLQTNNHLSILRYIRAHKLREPHLVVRHGTLLLNISPSGEFSRRKLVSSSLGDAEKLSALEQLCMSSLDVGNLPLAESCLDALLLAGGNANGATTTGATPLITKESTRYRKLLALCLESTSDYDGALKIYDALLKENPANSHAARRKYCILAARANDIAASSSSISQWEESSSGAQLQAYSALNDYLQHHPGEVTAWNEMAEFCLSRSDYKGAAYCYEEVILACPLDSDVHTKLGEVYATIGGIDNLKLARKHLAQALNLNGGNLRGVWSLVAVAESYLEEVEKLAGGKGGSRGISKELEEESVAVAKELILHCGEKLMGFYKGSGRRLEKVVEQVLKDCSEAL